MFRFQVTYSRNNVNNNNNNKIKIAICLYGTLTTVIILQSEVTQQSAN